MRLRTDGGLKTAEDIVMAAVLGAEEFGFGTSVLVAIGCDMARQCHLNSCPTGIATQREDLRAKYTGTPDQVVTYFLHLAGAIREELAALGARTLDELVGRTDLLAARIFPVAPACSTSRRSSPSRRRSRTPQTRRPEPAGRDPRRRRHRARG